MAKAALPESDSVGGIGTIKFWTSIMKELGIPGFVVLFFTMFFLTFADKSQRQEFIDDWFLFKNVGHNSYPFAFIVLALLMVIIFQHVHYNKIIKAKQAENDRIGEEKSGLQQKLLNKRLNTSK